MSGESYEKRVMLTGRSVYARWRDAMKSLLVEKKVWGIISKDVVVKADDLSDEEKEAIAYGILRGAITDTVLNSYAQHETAKALWEALNESFWKADSATKHTWKKEMYAISWDNCASSSEYLNKLVKYFAQFSAAGDPIPLQDQIEVVLAGLNPRIHSDIQSLATVSGTANWTIESLAKLILKHPEPRSKLPQFEGKSFLAKACRICRKGDHLMAKCPGLTCRRCGKKGHFASQCEAPNTEIINKTIQNSWRFLVVDSGTSDTMSPEKDMLTNYVPVSESIEVAGGGTLEVVGKGNLQIGPIELEGVRHVPDLQQPLLSVNQLTKNGNKVFFGEDSVMIMDKNHDLILEGKKDPNYGDLYILGKTDKDNLVEGNSAAFFAKKSDTLMGWHARLGHMNLDRILSLSKQSLTEGISLSDDARKQCEACVLSKDTQSSLDKTSSRKPSTIGDIISGDLSGPFKPNPYGAKYVSILVDHFSGWTNCRFLSCKDAEGIFEHLQDFVIFLKNQSRSGEPVKVKIFRSDGGGEYCNDLIDRYLASEGIQREVTAPYHPAGNGRSERKNRTIIESMKAMLKGKKLPLGYWPYALKSACYIHNRTSTSPFVQDITPYEIVFGFKPDVSNIHEFGSKCWIHQEGKQPKLKDKARQAILLGYEEGQEGYIVLERKGISVTRSIVLAKDERIEVPDTDSFWNTISTAETEIDEVEDDASSESQSSEENEQEQIEEAMTRRLNPTRNARFKGSYAFLAKVMTEGPDNPTLEEALSGPEKEKWTIAVDKEVETLLNMGVIEPANLPTGKTLVGSKFVLTKKRGADGAIIKEKARWTAQGFSQRAGIDFFETFAPTVRQESLMLLFHIAAAEKMEIHQMDFDSAYLNADLKEEIYLRPPKQLESRWPGKVLKVKKALYGLKQSANAWYELLYNTLESLGWKRCDSDPCVFFREGKEGRSYLAVYVDDLVILSQSKKQMDSIKEELKGKFKCKDLGVINHILGIQVDYDQANGTMLLNQKNQIERSLKTNGISRHEKRSTPMDTQPFPMKNESQASEADIKTYQEMIGALLYYAQRTRPDIAVSVNILSRFATNPSSDHLERARRIFHYLNQTIDWKLRIVGTKPLTMRAFCDADWAGDHNDRKSTSGYVIRLGESLCAWSSRKQNCVSLSTAEAEYVALVDCAKECIWMKRFLEELGYKIGSWVLECDNQAAIQLTNSLTVNSRTKHIDIRHKFLLDLLSCDQVQILYVNSKANLADVFTKPLSKEKHYLAAASIGLLGLADRGSVDCILNPRD